MPSVVQTQTISSVGYMLKEKSEVPVVAAFTAVNGRTSPTDSRKLSGLNGMSADTIHVRPLSQPHSEPAQDQKSLPGREKWPSAPRAHENGTQNGHYSVSPSLDGSDRSPQSPGKRKRSSSAEDDRSFHSPSSAPVQVRRRLDSYASTGRDDSPHTVSQGHSAHMEHTQHRTLPPMSQAEHDRSWAPRESQDMAPNGAHYRDARTMEPPHEHMNHHPTQSPNQANGVIDLHPVERTSTTEITRAGVQVDPKKRKRQFANRTKTGCGTCRRRKKKCDEMKPECNNCQRGGFICEGYQNKVPWPKNGVTKPPPPLQAKDQYSLEPAQMYHSHGTRPDNYPEPAPSDGARNRPIVVDDHERPVQGTRTGWGVWGEPPRASHPSEHPQSREYPHPPPTATHSRPTPNEHYAQQPPQGPPPPRQHNPRIYHHTPATMSQVHSSSPGMPVEGPPHHPGQQPPHQQPAVGGPPGPPPPSHYPQPPPRQQKSEKDKMLSGEPFIPFTPDLLAEREFCRKAVSQFNGTSKEGVQITRDEQARHFQTIVQARWVRPRHSDPPMHGHVGTEVFVDTPFHCDYGYNLVIGDFVTIGAGCKLQDSGRIQIGRNSRICANVTIDTQRVPTDSKSVKGSRGHTSASEVHIGENVYIGAGVTICAGVKIGTGAIIHPGSVVMKDVPRDCIARGNPANVQAVNWED